MLAICFACKRFHQYICGLDVDVKTDHRPLEIIFQKPLGKIPSRSQQMLLQLQHYVLKVWYVPVSHLHIADAEGSSPSDEDMIHMLATTSPVSAVKWQAMKPATADNPTLQSMCQCLTAGWSAKTSVCRGENLGMPQLLDNG